MTTQQEDYPANFNIDYSDTLDRFTTFFRLLWGLPVVILLSILTSPGGSRMWHDATEKVSTSGGDIGFGLFAATALMIVFRQRYPRWWFDFALELNRFSARVGAYVFLLTDRYPSTTDKQAVRLNVDYPNVERDLNQWLPLVKWFLAIPHYIVLAFLVLGAAVATVFAWFAILFTGQYPRGLFDYVVGVGRWALRVNAYAFLLVTDKYPPFSLS